MIVGTLILASLALVLTCLLILAERWLGSGSPQQGLAEQVEQLLPRIQCAQCGWPGCRAYAEAIASGRAPINRCPPGGERTVQRLSALLGEPVLPLDTSLGRASMRQAARIDEALCIGCNLCARACPVDAISGIPQMMHAVIESHCTGCELCLPACPVDCIELVARHA